jgi:hypothetical protein
VLDLEVQRGGVVEDELHIEIEQIGQAEVERLLDGLLGGFEEVHGAIQMLEREGVGPLDAHVLGEPALVAVELRARGTEPVRHHGEQRPLDRELELALAELLFEDLRDAEASPQVLEDVDGPVGPGVGESSSRVEGEDLVGRAPAQDAAREPSQPLGDLGIVGPPAVVDDAHPGALALRVPDVLGELEVGQVGPVGAFLPGLAQIHLRNGIPASTCTTRTKFQTMYLCIFGSVTS